MSEGVTFSELRALPWGKVRRGTLRSPGQGRFGFHWDVPKGSSGLVVILELPALTHAAEIVSWIGTHGLGTLCLAWETRPDEEASALIPQREEIINRLAAALEELELHPQVRRTGMALIGESVGAHLALRAAARSHALGLRAVVVLGGEALGEPEGVTLNLPTLLVAAEGEEPSVQWTEAVAQRLRGERRLVILPQRDTLFGDSATEARISAEVMRWLRYFLHVGHREQEMLLDGYPAPEGAVEK